MPYRKGNVPATLNDLPRFLDQELSRVERSQNEGWPFFILDKLHAAPKKTLEGMIVLADGTDWNPGSGGGVYCFRAGAWRFLG